MGIFDKLKGKAADLKGKATDLVDEHGDKIGGGLDKAGKLADDKTGGKYSDKIEQAVDKAKDRLDGLDGKDDDIDNGPAKPGRPA